MAAGITREQLRAKTYRGDDFLLVEALSQKHYESSHLPGTVNLFPTKAYRQVNRLCLRTSL